MPVPPAWRYLVLTWYTSDVRRRRKCLLLSEVIGEDGLPTIERAFRISRPAPPKMLDHGVLITHDRVLVASPELAVDGIPASRADHHQVGLKQQPLLRLDIRRRI